MALREQLLIFFQDQASFEKIPWMTQPTRERAMEWLFPGGRLPTAAERDDWPSKGCTPQHWGDDVILGAATQMLLRKLVIREVSRNETVGPACSTS